MSVFLTLNESSASSRCVPMWMVQSNGTSAATNESGRTFFFSIGGVDFGSGGSLSAISANAGLYSANFAASKISVMGQGFVYYSSSTALPTMTPIMVVPFNSFDSMRLGLTALPNAGANASGGLPQKGTIHSDFTVRLDTVAYSGATVGAGNFTPGVYSGVSFSIRDSGIATTSYQLGNYSGVSFEVKSSGIGIASITSGTYSGVTFGINNITPGSYSGFTVAGINDPTTIWNAQRSLYTAIGSFGLANQVVSDKTLAGGTRSTLTLASTETGTDNFFAGAFVMVQYASGQWIGDIISSYSGSNQTATLQNQLPITAASGMTYVIFPGNLGVDLSTQTIGGINNIKPAIYSGVTVGINNIAAAAYSGVTIDGAKFLSSAGERSAASSLLSTNLGNTRFVQEALFVLRNKTLISGSTGTVFLPDDTTSSFTFSVTTDVVTIVGVDPTG